MSDYTYRLFKPFIADDSWKRVKNVLESGMIGEGPEVAKFEDNLSSLLDTKHVVATNSGTSSLIMALKLAGVGPGDHVISTPVTMAATNCAIKAVGAEPLFVDVEKNNLFLDIEQTRIAVLGDKEPKAVIGVAMCGLVPSTLESFSKLGIPFILDAAHAFGSLFDNQPLCHFADYTCYSFQAIKTITTGDGGALVCKDSLQHEKAKRMKWFGLDRAKPNENRLKKQDSADIIEAGFKFHMNDISAAIGNANLGHLDDILKTSRRNAEIYNKKLNIINADDKIGYHVKTLYPSYYTNPSWWVYGLYADYRDELIRYLNCHSIEAAPVWKRNDQMTAFGPAGADFEITSKYEHQFLLIPSGWWQSVEDTEFIASKISEFYKLKS